jgi:hypothetical protein
VCFVVHKTTSNLGPHPLVLAGAKNTDSWRARKGDLQRAFPLDVPMVTSLKFAFVANGRNLTGVGLAPGETIRFSSLEFNVNHLGSLSISPKERDSGANFIGMVHIRSPSLHTILEDSSDEDGATPDAGGAWISQTSRVQRGNLDCPHHHYTGTGEHPGTPDHPDGHGEDRSAPAKDGTPPRSTASLPGGAATVGPHSTNQC